MWALKDDRAQVERLRRVLIDRSQLTEADEAVELLHGHPDGLSATEIAMRLHRRKADVLAAMRHDSRFTKVGNGRGTRYRIAPCWLDWTREPKGTGQQRSSGASPPSPELRDPQAMPAPEIAPEEVAVP
jgi:hypothetical protein